MTKIRFTDLILDLEAAGPGNAIIGSAEKSHFLMENCTLVCNFQTSDVKAGFSGWNGAYDCSQTNAYYGQFFKGTIVNCYLNGLHNDAFRGGCLINTTCEFAGKFVPGQNPVAHMDMYQVYYENGIMDNYVIHGLTATERVATQGILLSGNSIEFRSFYIKNCKIDVRASVNGVPYQEDITGQSLYNYYVFKNTKGFLVSDCEFNNGYIYNGLDDLDTQTPGVDGVFDGEGTVFHNVTLNNSIETMFPWPDRYGGSGKGGFYEKAGSPPFPWKSPATNITYTSTIWVDYILDPKIMEGNSVVPDANEITPATKSLSVNAITDQNDVTYQWTVTSSDGDLSDVTNTTGTNENFDFIVTAGNNDRVYTVTVETTSAALGETTSKSVTYKVRPPVAFPVTFQGIIPDSGGNFYDLYRSALQPGDTWLDNDGENVLPDAWIQLTLRSYKRGMSLYFSSEEELITRFLGEYAGKNMTLTFGDATATLNGPIQVGTIGDPGVTCELVERTEDGAYFLRFPNDGDDSVWDVFPGTISRGDKPFTISFTNP